MDTLGFDGQEPMTQVDAPYGLITKFFPGVKLTKTQALAMVFKRLRRVQLDCHTAPPETLMAMT